MTLDTPMYLFGVLVVGAAGATSLISLKLRRYLGFALELLVYSVVVYLAVLLFGVSTYNFAESYLFAPISLWGVLFALNIMMVAHMIYRGMRVLFVFRQ